MAGLWREWRRLGKEPAALFALAFGLLLSGANHSLFVVYGVWLEDAYGLSIVALGATALVLGLGDLSGEVLTATISDRLGLKRAVMIGSVSLVVSYLILPVLGRSLVGALVGLFIVFLTFEFTVVTNSSFVVGVLPDARATMLSSLVAAGSIGRMIGVMVGGIVWLAGGLMANSLFAAVIAALAVVCFAWGFREWQPNPQET